jgi:sterol desaturase/sphingolipid hydroxylase (fatty acid hydroxylase superfamily)
MAWAFAAILGVMTWSFLEYMLHRFLGHDRRFMPNFFSKEHTLHHSVGDYFAPTWKKVVVASVVFVGVSALASFAVGLGLALTYAASFAGMYTAYEVLHRRMHTHPGIGHYFRYMRRHHFSHHFTSPKMNHGVTSPLWDWVFGTYAEASRIRVPRKLAMGWLWNSDRSGVVTRFEDHYEIV